MYVAGQKQIEHEAPSFPLCRRDQWGLRAQASSLQVVGCVCSQARRPAPPPSWPEKEAPSSASVGAEGAQEVWMPLLQQNPRERPRLPRDHTAVRARWGRAPGGWIWILGPSPLQRCGHSHEPSGLAVAVPGGMWVWRCRSGTLQKAWTESLGGNSQSGTPASPTQPLPRAGANRPGTATQSCSDHGDLSPHGCLPKAVDLTGSLWPWPRQAWGPAPGAWRPPPPPAASEMLPTRPLAAWGGGCPRVLTLPQFTISPPAAPEHVNGK